MKLYIKQKVFSWGDKFAIKDESGQDIFFAKGEVFSFGKKLHIYDFFGIEVAFIHQKVFSFLPKFFIEINGQSFELVKEFTFLKPRYSIRNLGWEIDGDFFGHEYSVTQHGGTVMRMSKEWFTWGDSYVIDISEPRDAILCLCIALGIDCIVATQNN